MPQNEWREAREVVGWLGFIAGVLMFGFVMGRCGCQRERASTQSPSSPSPLDGLSAVMMKDPKTLDHARRECKRLRGEIESCAKIIGARAWAGRYTPAPTYAHAIEEMNWLRADLRLLLKILNRESLEAKESQDITDGLILEGDSRPGHEFDHI